MNYVDENAIINGRWNLELVSKYILCQFTDEMIHNANAFLSSYRNILNNEQLKAFNWVVQTGGFADNCVSLRQAGYEKSYLLKCDESCLINKQILDLIMAATKITVLLIGDITFHLSFGIIKLDDQKFPSSAKVNNILDTSLILVQFLISDEISMIYVQMLDLFNSRLRLLKSVVNSSLGDMAFDGVWVLMKFI